MATREENIKKINDELEKLDDEQIEQVASGTLFRPHRTSRSFTSGEEKIRLDSATVDMDTGRL